MGQATPIYFPVSILLFVQCVKKFKISSVLVR